MLKHFDNQQTKAKLFVDTESIGLVTQWILRMMVLSGGKEKFLSHRGFIHNGDDVASFLGFQAYVDDEEITQKELNKELKYMYAKYENNIYPIDAALTKNIKSS